MKNFQDPGACISFRARWKIDIPRFVKIMDVLAGARRAHPETRLRAVIRVLRLVDFADPRALSSLRWAERVSGALAMTHQ